MKNVGRYFNGKLYGCCIRVNRTVFYVGRYANKGNRCTIQGCVIPGWLCLYVVRALLQVVIVSK